MSRIDELAARVLADLIILNSVSFVVPEEMKVTKEFHDRMKLASEFVIKESMLLEPGKYIVILGEPRKVVFKPA